MLINSDRIKRFIIAQTLAYCMGLFFELKTPEAKYIKDMSNLCHFGIDCACGGKDGEYSGSHYKNASEDHKRVTKRYTPRLRETKLQHTFYLNEPLLVDIIEEHEQNSGESPLVIVCNDCSREFPFTRQSYRELSNRLMEEYARKIAEKGKLSPKPRKHK